MALLFSPGSLETREVLTMLGPALRFAIGGEAGSFVLNVATVLSRDEVSALADELGRWLRSTQPRCGGGTYEKRCADGSTLFLPCPGCASCRP